MVSTSHYNSPDFVPDSTETVDKKSKESMARPAPEISIVVPAYNAERFLPECVASMQAQTYTEWEMLIVNDGSSDETGRVALELARDDSRIRVFEQNRTGVSGARNLGVSLAKGSYIGFLDADDVLMPDTLETLMSALSGHPEWAGVHGLSRYIDEMGQPIRIGEMEYAGRSRVRVSRDSSRREVSPLSVPTTFEMQAICNCIPIGTVLFRRSDFERAGRFSEQLAIGEDWHMWLRINLMKPIGFVDRVVLSYRRHAANASQGVWKMRRGRFDVAKSIYETCSMNAAQERIFWRSLSVGCHIYWAVDYLRRRQPMMAVRHVAHAAHNLVQYHVLPKFSRNVSGEDAIHE